MAFTASVADHRQLASIAVAATGMRSAAAGPCRTGSRLPGPGTGTVTVRVAVPFFRLRCSLPRIRSWMRAGAAAAAARRPRCRSRRRPPRASWGSGEKLDRPLDGRAGRSLAGDAAAPIRRPGSSSASAIVAVGPPLSWSGPELGVGVDDVAGCVEAALVAALEVEAERVHLGHTVLAPRGTDATADDRVCGMSGALRLYQKRFPPSLPLPVTEFAARVVAGDRQIRARPRHRSRAHRP